MPDTRSLPAPSPLIAHWMLEPGTVFLNHGSFGATPRAVIEAEARWRARFEAEPVRFVVEEMEPALDEARAALSPLLGTTPDTWAFVMNATAAVNCVARSLRLSPGDELVASTHEYNACSNALEWAAQRAGATVVRVPWPFPVPDEQALIDLMMRAITPRTRLVLLSAVTSPTGFITPFEMLVQTIQSRGVDVMLDAAHGPGFIDLDLSRVQPAFATGNFHKWLCAPKGSAFIFVRADKQAGIDPAVISHGFNTRRTDRSRFHLQFDYWGTEEPSRYLATPDAARFVPTLLGAPAGTQPDRQGGLPMNLKRSWSAVIAHNRALALRGRDILCAALGTPPPVPDHLLGSMAAVMLPDHPPALMTRLRARPTKYHDALQDALLARHHVQVPILPSLDGTRRWVRISAQVYNSEAQYAYLAGALRDELRAESAG